MQMAVAWRDGEWDLTNSMVGSKQAGAFGLARWAERLQAYLAERLPTVRQNLRVARCADGPAMFAGEMTR